MFGNKKDKKAVKYPGTRMALDGNQAVIMCERNSSDAAGAYPITPSTQMGEFWAVEVSNGYKNISDKPLIFIEPESEHAAAAVTSGMSMTGLRATNFSSAQGIAFMHESLYTAVGKRLPYVLNIACRAITKASLNVHCGHDDYHCIDDTGFFQIFAKNAQEAADLNLIGRKIAELSLTPAAVAQDGFLTTHLIEPMMVPERALILEFLGKPDDIIECPTPAQKIVYGETRRRVPEVWDVDNPMSSGSVQNQDAYMQTTAAQRPFFFEHIKEITDQVMAEYTELTGRDYSRVSSYQLEDAEYVIVTQGSLVVQIEAVIDYLRESRDLKVGVVNMTMYRPFPGDKITEMLKGKKGVCVMERTDQPLAEDLPLIREIRAAVSKATENGKDVDNIAFVNHAVYEKIADIPTLYSACFGLGSRDIQPEGVIAAYENMMPEGDHKRFVYIGIDFMREASTPKQEIHFQKIKDSYPHLLDMSIKGSENPDLLPKSAVTVRMHSVGGWGAITTGKNLAMTLYDLLGYDIRANPKYGSEKKGQPTTYFLSAAPEPIRLACEYHYVDVVLSPDPNVFSHSNPLSGLNDNGYFIIQSNLGSQQAVWATIPKTAQNFIIKHNIRIFYIDGFKIAKEEASNPDLEFRMQGNAFQGAFFAASPLIEKANLTEETLFEAINKQLEDKFGHKGKHVVEDNLRVVRRGFDEIHEITDKETVTQTQVLKAKTSMPVMLKELPEGDGGISDIHRFWEQAGSFYAKGEGDQNIADPFQALSLVPASTGIFRDMTNIRFEIPEFIPENCTACGDCYTQCPDSAIPGLVNTFSEIFNSAILRIELGGNPSRFLRRESRTIEKKLKSLIDASGENPVVSQLLDQAMLETLHESELEGKEKESLEREFGRLAESIGDFRFAVTKPYYSNKEKKKKGSGGLFSITVNPYTCKGCMECIEVCKDDALVAITQTEDNTKRLKDEWKFWLDLPTTQKDFIRIDDLNEKIGALDTLLLDKSNYMSMDSGDGACLGCGEKTSIHIFTGAITALMQPRVATYLAKIDHLIEEMEIHIRLKLAETIDLSSIDKIKNTLDDNAGQDMSLSDFSNSLDKDNATSPVDQHWLKHSTKILEELRHLKWLYTQGKTNRGRSNMGFTNATGCTSVWGSTYPYNPYPFPWSSNLFQDAPSLAMGVFEGHMRKMANGFTTIRKAELELANKYDFATDDDFMDRFNWKQFTKEEWLLCPPVVAVGGDGAMYDIGFQNLSRAMMSGMPIKILILDTQVYSNTGGQACTSGFVSQISDMAPYGTAMKGKEEIRKEISLIGLAHRTSFVLQSSMSHTTHMMEGFIDGLNSTKPALFNLYAVCQPEHGVADDAAAAQAKMAVESRAYPLFRFDPDEGVTLEECSTVEGNPSIKEDWFSYTLNYLDENQKEQQMELPFTFADWALTEGRFAKHFKKVPAKNWNDNMMPLHEYINEEEDEDIFPYIWTIDAKNQLVRTLVSKEMVTSVKERRDFWHQLRALSGEDEKFDEQNVIDQTKAEMAQQLSSALLELTGNSNVSLPLNNTTPASNGSASTVSVSTDFEPAWIETPECTTCDECTDINNNIFKYDANKLAYIADPTAGSFKDIVKAAEKCTAECLHPGTPFNPNEKDLDKLIKRAEKYQ